MNTETDENWRSFSSELAQLSMRLCKALPSDNKTNQQLVISLLFARAHQSFQATIVLAERGFHGEARTLVRSAAENAIAIAATFGDASFVDRLIEADQERRLKWINATFSHPELQQDLTPEEMRKLRDTKEEIGDKKPKSIQWDAVAAVSGATALYHLHYRPMSWHTHTGIESLNGYAQVDAAENITGIKCDGDTAGYAATVRVACDVLFWASVPTAEFFALRDLLQEIRTMHRRLFLPRLEFFSSGD